jgi:hypothetical protein
LIFENTGTTAAGVTAAIYAAQALGIPHTFEIVCSGDKAFSILYSALAYSKTIGQRAVAKCASATGGIASSGLVVPGIIHSAAIRNDDGAVNLAWVAHVWSHLGLGPASASPIVTI